MSMAKPKSPNPKQSTTPAAKTQASSSSLDELRFRRAVQKSVTRRILSTTALPELTPPSLEGLTVKMSPIFAEVDDADLLDRLGEIARENAPRRHRSSQEQIAQGDELTLTIVGFCRGSLIPLTFRQGVIVENQPGGYLPGFMEGLQGARVGSSVQVRLNLPPNFGIAALQGQPAVFAVDILGAAEQLPVDITSEQFLYSLGMGQNHIELFDTLTEEIRSERAVDSLTDAFDAVIKELAKRAPPQIPESLIDEEIGRRWRRMEGDHLSALQIPVPDQEGSLAAWLDDPKLREEIRQALAKAQLLLAVFKGEKLELVREEFIEMVSEGAVLVGADLKQSLRELKGDPELIRRLTFEAMTRKASNYLIERCISME
jgi:trigger factor